MNHNLTYNVGIASGDSLAKSISKDIREPVSINGFWKGMFAWEMLTRS